MRWAWLIAISIGAERIVAMDGAVMKGWFLEPRSRTGKCVAVLHGIGDSRLGALGFAPMFLRQGYAVLTPDSRGHGQSGGEIATYGVREADDALRWADWMRGQGCTDVVGLGESLGGAVLLQAVGIPRRRRGVRLCQFPDYWRRTACAINQTTNGSRGRRDLL